jgi:hypothetical protein
MRILFRILALVVLILGVLSIVRRLLGALVPPQQARPGPGGHLVKDPICGTFVPQNTALQARDEFFCSEECRRKFLA